MEITIFFLFLIIALVLIFLAHFFSDFNILALAAIIFLFLGVNMMGWGYDRYETSIVQGSFNYTFNDSISTNMLSSASFVGQKATRNIQDIYSLVIGLMILGSGVLMAVYSVYGRKR